jgi:protein TonB
VKKILFTLISLTIILAAKAQTPDTLKGLAADTVLFYTVEHEPEFPGGLAQFYKYVITTLRYPADARAITKQGKVIVQFIIEKDGSISHVKVLRKVFPSLDAEAVRVVIGSPKWIPGMQNGYRLRVVYTLPISFNLAM